MADNTKIPPLTPLEKTQLEALLRKVEGFRAGPVANQLREEQKLKAERETLAAEERRAQEHLHSLQAALDRVSGEIDALIAQRPGSFQDRILAGAARPGTLRVRKEAKVFADRLRDLLARGTLKDLTAQELTNIFQAGVTSFVNPTVPQPPQLTLRQYLRLDPCWDAWRRISSNSKTRRPPPRNRRSRFWMLLENMAAIASGTLSRRHRAARRGGTDYDAALSFVWPLRSVSGGASRAGTFHRNCRSARGSALRRRFVSGGSRRTASCRQGARYAEHSNSVFRRAN